MKLFILLNFFSIFLISITFADFNGGGLAKNNTFLYTGDSYKFFSRPYYISLVSKQRNIITAPIKWNFNQWLVFTGVIGSISIAYHSDTSINDTLLNQQNTLTKVYANTGYVIGHPINLLPLIGLTYTYGYATKNSKLQHLGLSSFESLLFTLTVVKTSKMLVHRHRPNETQSHSTFDGPGFSLSEINQSFPSGHSAAIWAVATSIALEYNESSWIKLSSYCVASLVALSRLFDNAHWASDVIAGSALGYSIARYTFFNNQTKDINKVRLTPLFYNQTGLAVTMAI